MKKLRTFFAATIMLLCTTLQAQDFYTGGLYYNILSESEKTVEVTNINGGGIDAFYQTRYSGHIEIPDEVIHNGKRYSVVAIGEGAFSSNEYLNWVSIPSSVKSIGDYAFYASSVKEFDHATKIMEFTSIGKGAFYGCRNLREFTIPSTTVSIGSEAFRECWALKKVVIGENVTGIGQNAFYGTAIDDVFSNIPADRLSALTNNADLTRNATLVVPAGTKETYAATDGWKDFANIVEVKGRYRTEEFLYDIISYKNNYVSIHHAKEFTGEHVVPSTVEYDGTTYTVTAIDDWSYTNMGLTKVTIPNTVKVIGSFTFQNCKELEEIVFDGVEEIHYGAFYGIGIRELNIPASTRYINVSFTGCSNIETITVAAGNSVYNSSNNCNAIMETGSNTLIKGCKNTVIPSNTKIIGAAAFNQNMEITEIEIPYGVECIELYSFLGCSNLTKITIPNSVNRIGEGAFYDCEILTEITIPDNVTEIAPRTFEDCSLREIIIPEQVAFIADDAFIGNNSTSITVDENNPYYDSRDNCNAIIETASNTLISGCKNTIIPDDITTIRKEAFYRCAGLTNITIPNSVTTIEDLAFYECSGLTNITIPANVTAIGQNVLYGCSALKKITSLIPGERLEEVELEDYPFDEEILINCVLEVPFDEKYTYENTDPWSSFRMIVEPGYRYFDLNVSAAGYATLYLDFNAYIPSGVELYTASSVDGNRLMMEQVEYGILPANTGVLVKAEQGTYTFVDTYGAINGYIENNLFRGSAEDVYITPAKEAKYYVLAMKDGVVGMYEDALSGGTFKNNANKAYLVLSPKIGIYDEEVDTEDPGMQLSNSYYFDFSGTTAIDPVVTEVNDNIYYDLSGRRVENPTRGIYIVNGKKRLVK